MTRTISVEVVVPSRGTPPRIGDRYTWDTTAREWRPEETQSIEILEVPDGFDRGYVRDAVQLVLDRKGGLSLPVRWEYIEGQLSRFGFARRDS